MSTLAERIAPLAERFRRDGFVVVPGLLTPDELERYGRVVDEAVARRKRYDWRKLSEKSPYEQSFIQCTNLWEDSPEVLPLTFHPLVAETAARLLGIERIRLWHDQALYKEAGGRLTDPHQDQPYWPLLETDTITAWIPFDGSSDENGCMGYVPGSHAIGLRKFGKIFPPENALEILKLPEIRDTPPVFTVYFSAPHRVDFRALVRDLAGRLGARLHHLDAGAGTHRGQDQAEVHHPRMVGPSARTWP